MVNPKDWMVKIFPTFPQRLIDTVCQRLAQMYKVESNGRCDQVTE